jgi:pimeloyl-ACP methyl ester carboxylesterase
LTLPDGRRFAYAEYGNPQGHPTLYFHGFPGSRLEAGLADAAAAHARVRLIAVDRPGFGGSDFKPGRRLTDWPADVARLADHLELERFSIVGVSGGGPYAAACAHAISDRLASVAIVSGLAPMQDPTLLEGMLRKNQFIVRAAQRVPFIVGPLLRPAILLRAFPQEGLRALRAMVDTPDQRVLMRADVLEALSRSLVESLRQGTRGPAHELSIIVKPWGFALEEIGIPILLWHGGRDPIVPPSHFHHLQERLTQSRGEFMPDEGHFSLVIGHVAQIFASLEQARARMSAA